MDETRTALQEALDNAQKIGYLKAQNQMLKFIVELNKQGRISNDLANLFAMELSLDLE